jgi:hypothetical protein
MGAGVDLQGSRILPGKNLLVLVEQHFDLWVKIGYPID